jgi:hypothetical protein
MQGTGGIDATGAISTGVAELEMNSPIGLARSAGGARRGAGWIAEFIDRRRAGKLAQAGRLAQSSVLSVLSFIVASTCLAVLLVPFQLSRWLVSFHSRITGSARLCS